MLTFVVLTLVMLTFVVLNLRGADLRDADLRGADLRRADGNSIFLALIAVHLSPFKKANNDKKSVIVKLQIAETAKRSSATGRKCRCNEAIVLGIESLDGLKTDYENAYSSHDSGFIYAGWQNRILLKISTQPIQ